MSVVHGLGQRIRQAISEVGRPGGGQNGAGCQVLAVAAQKGGVGKTTTAVSLAVALANDHKLRVLLVDLDNQCHVASSLRDHMRTSAIETVSSVLLARDPDLTRAAVPTTIAGLSVTGADRQLANTEAQLASRIGRDLLLGRALTEARSRFDLVVIDCPPNLGLLTVNALVAADQVLVPCDLSILSLEGVDGLIETLRNLEASFGRAPEVLGLLHTRVDRRNLRHNAAIRAAVAKRYSGYALATEIGVNTAIADAQLRGRSIFHAHPKSRGAADYRALAQEVVPRLYAGAATAMRRVV